MMALKKRFAKSEMHNWRIMFILIVISVGKIFAEVPHQPTSDKNITSTSSFKHFFDSHQSLEKGMRPISFSQGTSARIKRSRPRSIDGSSGHQNITGIHVKHNLSSPSISQCGRFAKQKDFFVIGHAGGDPLKHCENTLESTWSALEEGGANAIEIDLSMSKDGVIFLWHDTHPLGIVSLLRRMGFALNGRCRPKMDFNKASYDLTFKEIQDNWYYEDVSYGGKHHSSIPTLDNWLKTFANDQRIKLIWLDVKVNVESKLKQFVEMLTLTLNKYNIQESRLQFSVREVKIGAKLQEEFFKAGYPGLSKLIVTDTQPVVPYVTSDIVHRFDGIAKALPTLNNEMNLKCSCCASLGLPLAMASRWESFKQIVLYNVNQRNLMDKLTGSHIRIYSFTIDNKDQMDWLLESGIDGIITNNPKLLSMRIFAKNDFNQPRFLPSIQLL